MDYQFWGLIPEIDHRYEKNVLHMQIFHQVIIQTTLGEMIFMDYRFALTAAMETAYTDALGRPKLHLAGFDMFRSGSRIQ